MQQGKGTSAGHRLRASAAIVFAVLVLAVAAPAQDAAPAAPAAPKTTADPLQAEVDAIHALGQGKSAKEAIDRFFTVHAKDPRVLAYLPALESDLRRSLFRLSGSQPSMVQLLGRGATKYESSSGRVEFKVKSLTEADGWEDAGDDVRFFDALFDGEVSVEMSKSVAWETIVLLGFDSETRGAYVFIPVPDGEYRHVRALRFDPGSNEPVEIPLVWALLGEITESVRYAVSKSKVMIETTNLKEYGPDRRDLRSGSDGKYQRGFVAVRGSAKLDAAGLTITGKLDQAYARRQIAEAEARRYREWRGSKWKRAEVLPSWIADLETSGRAWIDTVPRGCPPDAREHFVALMRAAFDALQHDDDTREVGGLSGVAADWQEALVALIGGRYADADAAARRVISADPKFAPAHVVAGVSLLARGDDDAAVPLLEEACRLDPAFAPARDGLAQAAFWAGDLDRAQAVLADEAAAGLTSAVAAQLRHALFRVRRGPDWKKRFESFSTNYVVSGDTSVAVCAEVARTLEEAADTYARQFRPRRTKTRGRVRVFSGFDSYADYVGEFGADATNTLGMYNPSLRELCVWLHEDRPELANTIRHEGFHQYLHDLVDEVPIWFNEGYAEYFGFSRRKQSSIGLGATGELQAAIAKALLPKFSPLSKLFVMEPREFMANAGVHYVQSWAVVHMLRDTTQPKLKGILDRYLDALLAGKSARQAYDAVLAPVLTAIEDELSLHVRLLESK